MTVQLTPQLNVADDAALGDVTTALRKLNRPPGSSRDTPEKGLVLAFERVHPLEERVSQIEFIGTFSEVNHEPFVRYAITREHTDGRQEWSDKISWVPDRYDVPYREGSTALFHEALVSEFARQRQVLDAYEPLRLALFEQKLEEAYAGKVDRYSLNWMTTWHAVPAVEYLDGLGVLGHLHVLPRTMVTALKNAIPGIPGTSDGPNSSLYAPKKAWEVVAGDQIVPNNGGGVHEVLEIHTLEKSRLTGGQTYDGSKLHETDITYVIKMRNVVTGALRYDVRESKIDSYGDRRKGFDSWFVMKRPVQLGTTAVRLSTLPEPGSIEALRYSLSVLRAQGLNEAVEEVAQEMVDRWHSGEGEGQELHEFFGMTWDEYGKWANPAQS